MIKFIICFVSLFSISAFAEDVSFKIEGKNLKASGQVSSQANKPIFINGFDLAGAPYKLEIVRKPQGKEFLSVGYILERNGAKQSGNIITKVGQTAKIESQQSDPKSPGISFEATISY